MPARKGRKSKSTPQKVEPQPEENVAVESCIIDKDEAEAENPTSVKSADEEITQEARILPEHKENVEEPPVDNQMVLGKSEEEMDGIENLEEKVKDENTEQKDNAEQNDTAGPNDTAEQNDKKEVDFSSDPALYEPDPAEDLEKETIVPYKPHTFPSFIGTSLKEKWEWHMEVFPIDQADIRMCVLESVSKIAQETWIYIDKQNFGMGSFNMCLKNSNDAMAVMSKLLLCPFYYRYVTVKLTHRERKKSENSEEEEDQENIPYTEVLETATVLLDYVHSNTFQRVKGKEKKRSLYVKYMPEGTSKELLKVLFPVANNLDILTTEKGRRYGDLNVATAGNIRGICSMYVTLEFNGAQTISLDWNEENIDDGITNPAAKEESPWEIIPRYVEFAYESVPVLEEDEFVQYRKRKRGVTTADGQKKRLREDRGSRGGRDRRDSHGGGDMHPDDMMRMQREMADRIQHQLVFLETLDGPMPPRGGPLGGIPGLMDRPMLGSERPRDRRRNRPSRFEEEPRMPDRFDERREREFFGRRNWPGPEGPPPDGPAFGWRGRFPDEREPMFEGDPGFDFPRRGNFGGPPRRGRFDDRFDHGFGRGRDGGSRFDDQSPPGFFDGMGRGADFERPGLLGTPGRGGLLDMPGRGGFDGRPSPFDNNDGNRSERRGRGGGGFGRGGRPDRQVRGDSQSGKPENQKSSTGNKPDGSVIDKKATSDKTSKPERVRKSRFDNPGDNNHVSSKQGGTENKSGNQADSHSGSGNRGNSRGRGGNSFGNQSRGGGFNNNPGRGAGSFGNQSRGSGNYGNQGRGDSFGNQGRGGFGNQGRGGRNFNEGGRPGNNGGGNFGQSQGPNDKQAGKFGNNTGNKFGTNQKPGNLKDVSKSGNTGNYSNQGNFGNNQSSGNFGNNQFSGYGNNMNSGNFGVNQSSGSYGNNQSGGGFGNNQTTGNFGNNYGNNQTTGNYGTDQSMNYNTSQGGQFGNNQSGGFGNNQTPGVGNNQSTGFENNQATQQSGFGNQQTSYPNQGSYAQAGNYSTSQGTYGTQNSYQTNFNQQNSYSTGQQASYGTDQAAYNTTQNYSTQTFPNQQQSYTGQQPSTYNTNQQQTQQTPQTNYGTQQQGYDQSAYTTTGAGFWGQGGTGDAAYSTSQQPQQDQTNMAAYSTMQSYNTSSTAASGYAADASFASQGLYSTSATGSADYTAAYSTQTATNQTPQTTAYNFGQYPTTT